MSCFKLIFLIIFFCLSFTLWAGDKGLGIMLGNPTGINGKLKLSAQRSVDAGLGMALVGGNPVSLHSDYLWQNDDAFYFKDTYSLDLYFGMGGRMEFSDSIYLGPRFPVGLSHQLEKNDADVFFEVAPILDFIGKQGYEINLLFGSRYFF
jgi:hypothetical protein